MDSFTTKLPNSVAGITLIVTTTALATATVLFLFRWSRQSMNQKILPSPLNTFIPGLSEDERAKLDYTLDCFPGARDVATPVRLPPFPLLPFTKLNM